MKEKISCRRERKMQKNNIGREKRDTGISEGGKLIQREKKLYIHI